MALGEFELIDRYFTRSARPARRAVLGIGDDCALLAPAPGMLLATSSDLLIEGRHFVSTVRPERLGHKALAVNLSDLAACGARPFAFTLALALPHVDETFLAGFARGLFALADEHGCELVGGDTTRGPLAICITVFGEVPAGPNPAPAAASAPGRPLHGGDGNGAAAGGALLRSGARAGDDLYVSGTVGDARLALEVLRGTVSLPGAAFDAVRAAMEMPQPRVALGIALRGVATAAIDVSDGLLGDLQHILRRSGVGAVVEVDAVPRSAVLREQLPALQRTCTLAGGDDYELLFCAAPSQAAQVAAASEQVGVGVTRIGRIESGGGLRLLDAGGGAVADRFGSFDHFAP